MVQGGGAASPRPGLWVVASGRSRSPTNLIGKLAANGPGPLIARLAAKAQGWSGRSGFSGALSAGALGGKILGAGAGGFLLFYAPAERHEAIKRALAHLKPVEVAFYTLGSQIIFNEKIAH